MADFDPTAPKPKPEPSPSTKPPGSAGAAAPPSQPAPEPASEPGSARSLPNSTPGSLPPNAPTRIDRYVLLRALGEGGMGVVYAAYDEELDRKVALKLIHPSKQGDSEVRTRILREAQALARVSAPNVVTVYQVGEFDGQVFIAMEFVNGTTLTKWQQEKRHWLETLKMYLAAGQGLLAAHQVGLVHRDFKPDNVLIGKDGRPRVADFGLARMDVKPGSAPSGFVSQPMPALRKSNDETPLLSPVTQVGALLGTPLYMSPEQHLGDATDSRCDQFSFCVALYEALYGMLPFAGNTIEALAYNSISGKIRPRPHGSSVPMLVHQALLRGLSAYPAQRFPSMKELLTALTFDPAVDLAAGPRTRRRVTISMIAFMFIASLGMKLLTLAGIEAYRASLANSILYMAFFLFMAVRFFRAFRHPFHRGILVYGLTFGGELIGLRVIGLLIGLTYLQVVTLDLIALAAMTTVIASLVLSSLWPIVPLSLLCALLGVVYPQWAQALSSGAVVFTTIATLLLWNRAVDQRRPHTKRRKSRDKSRSSRKDEDSRAEDSDDSSGSHSFQRLEVLKEARTPTPTPTPAPLPLTDTDKTRS